MLRGILILIIISLVSGGIAYLGNRLGRFVGKKKFTVFNLRPMHTSTLFTIITGMLISLLTIGVASMLFENVRIALFGMEKLQQDRFRLQEEVNQLSNQASQGKIVFNAGQPIVIGLIDSGSSEDNVRKKIIEMIRLSNMRAIERNNRLAEYYKTAAIDSTATLADYKTENLDKAAKTINKSGGSWGVTISAANNTFLADKFYVDIKIIQNTVIYHKDDEIAEININTSKNKSEILADLFTLIYKARENVNARGMIRDPEQQISMPSGEALYDFVKKIQGYGGWVLVKAVAKKDLYVVDAPDIRLTIESTPAPE